MQYKDFQKIGGVQKRKIKRSYRIKIETNCLKNFYDRKLEVV